VSTAKRPMAQVTEHTNGNIIDNNNYYYYYATDSADNNNNKNSLIKVLTKHLKRTIKRTVQEHKKIREPTTHIAHDE
jgi:hypothetical protein